ncbi:MAG: hypothetical protein A2Y62_22030 [Candidatus Fischerbacteria bacterium RBG_13_37_8]|uniref:Uncharacterized protein n=1 Tax=Candidatus Fischerbacteria bacterium RBG_13_37_8 TaxID=1817863 RepID=A0A1F5VXD6_9BACT|nr:MAG: hypothetical protein A2Y62_22030 [Candidatus Fischerbacteria bacterium RBG_13_37_8]
MSLPLLSNLERIIIVSLPKANVIIQNGIIESIVRYGLLRPAGAGLIMTICLELPCGRTQGSPWQFIRRYYKRADTQVCSYTLNA